MSAAALPRPSNAVWAPNSVPQERFLRCGAYEALYGGAAGGGKSDALLAGALRYIHRPRYQGIIFRRHFPDLERSLVRRALEIYPATGGSWNASKYTWSWPSGARVILSHMKDDAAALSHKSAEYQYIAFDELTSFTRFQYTYLLSRGRTTDAEIPIRIRAGTNPGDVGHAWVLARFAPWLDPRPEYTGPRAAPGQVLHYLPRGDEEGDEYVAAGTEHALSRAFFPAFARDNPDLMRADPGYVVRLDGLDRVSRAQLKGGDWTVKPGKGELFHRDWWRYLDAAPPRSAWRRAVRSWDLAGSVTGDWTVGALYVELEGEHESPFVLVDVLRFRGSSFETKQRVLKTAEDDGPLVEVLLPQDPGQAGKAQADDFSRAKELRGYQVHVVRPTGKKVVRAKPHSSAVERGLCALVRAGWNHQFVEEHHDFPDGDTDDTIDAADDGYNHLTGVSPADFAAWSKEFGAVPRRGAEPAQATTPGIWLPDEDDRDEEGFGGIGGRTW